MKSFSSSIASAGELKVFGVAVVAVMVFAGIVNSATRSQMPTTVDPRAYALADEKRHGRPDYTIHPDEANKHVDVLARQCKGDFSKLPDDDQRWLDGMTAGNGPNLIFTRAKRLGIKVDASVLMGFRKPPNAM